MLQALIDRLGEPTVLALGGLALGGTFGFFAQRSRFCLRSAVIEFARQLGGGKLTVWLFAFAVAVIATQALAWVGWLDASAARQLSARGSLSGALVGGLLFGCGMILARGCSSRLLVLAAQGNLRSVISGLVFAVTAQASLGGVLAPLRDGIASWWTIDGGSSRDLLAHLGLGHGAAAGFGVLWLAAAVWWARRQRVPVWGWLGAIAVGITIACSWFLTYRITQVSFDPYPVQAMSFTGPSAELLSRVLFAGGRPLNFDMGLIIGVVAGAFIAAASFGELKLEGFQGGASMSRYLFGAVLMGFGGMLAGGCAVGAGLSGASVFALTAWITLTAIWCAAALTDRLLDHSPSQNLDQAMPGSSLRSPA
jgi:uncharacterized membrane protein YedE/YeeE